MMKSFFYIIMVALILIQFLQIDKTNPPLNKEMDFLTIKNTPEPIATQIRTSCYDCHSNETKYPWYSYLQPFGWLLRNHIEEGRKKLNFSIFSTYEPKRQIHKLYEAGDLVVHSAMPLESYLLIHNEAKLTNAQKLEIVQYLKNVEGEIRTVNTLPTEVPTSQCSE